MFNFFRITSKTVKSYAKINVVLRVLSKREDEYHNLDMVTLPLELHDVIEIICSKELADTYITSDDVALSLVHGNLCALAVKKLREVCGFKEQFKIHIHKEIPFAAGLGGGSSNAAAVLLAIKDLLRLKISQEKLKEIALEIGADVPFFLNPKPARIRGIGEDISTFLPSKTYHCLIVKPVKGLSTTEIYKICDSFRKGDVDPGKAVIALSNGDDFLLKEAIDNDLYAPAISIYPEVETIVNTLRNDGFYLSMMTGSGSACFALSNNRNELELEAKKMRQLGYGVWLTKTFR